MDEMFSLVILLDSKETLKRPDENYAASGLLDLRGLLKLFYEPWRQAARSSTSRSGLRLRGQL